MKILLTGAAGFIGMHVAKHLLERGDEVVGIDNLSDYYDVKLKQDRLEQLAAFHRFHFSKIDIADHAATESLFAKAQFQRVINLAAQPGARLSLNNPHTYVNSNVVGFLNVLEGCRVTGVEHLVFASSSSVYGANTKMPFSVHDNTNHPISLYAATKKSNELMAHTYSHLFGLPTTGLRFFTVYGPWGRPDMSPSLFARAILEGRAIQVFNHGHMKRDFTYIDDIVDGVLRVVDRIATPAPFFDRNNPDPASSYAPFRLYNFGNNRPVELLTFIELIENALGKKAIKDMLPLQAGDVETTYADIHELYALTEFIPTTSIEAGLMQFAEWFVSYYSATIGRR